jgi:hypothetical protein
MKTMVATDPHDSAQWLGAKAHTVTNRDFMSMTFERAAVPKVRTSSHAGRESH